MGCSRNFLSNGLSICRYTKLSNWSLIFIIVAVDTDDTDGDEDDEDDGGNSEFVTATGSLSITDGWVRAFKEDIYVKCVRFGHADNI